MHESMHFVLRVRCRLKESLRSLSHLLRSFLFFNYLACEWIQFENLGVLFNCSLAFTACHRRQMITLTVYLIELWWASSRVVVLWMWFSHRRHLSPLYLLTYESDDVAYRIADDVAHLASPVRQISEENRRELPDPDGQQAGVQYQSVGDGHHHQKEVGGELEHRFVSEDEEGKHVAECAKKDDDWRNVELQQLVSTILLHLAHPLHSPSEPHSWECVCGVGWYKYLSYRSCKWRPCRPTCGCAVICVSST